MTNIYTTLEETEDCLVIQAAGVNAPIIIPLIALEDRRLVYGEWADYKENGRYFRACLKKTSRENAIDRIIREHQHRIAHEKDHPDYTDRMRHLRSKPSKTMVLPEQREDQHGRRGASGERGAETGCES